MSNDIPDELTYRQIIARGDHHCPTCAQPLPMPVGIDRPHPDNAALRREIMEATAAMSFDNRNELNRWTIGDSRDWLVSTTRATVHRTALNVAARWRKDVAAAQKKVDGFVFLAEEAERFAARFAPR